ncbi:chromophore lyase CpcT/CpeT [Desertifilum sp. FACHB-1129]|uniref:Chromophore lyase CpcT/CpeT n=2 Tax=Desertifilum tharense IPPAS B-1220 TaxID=1781255 RepID=A0A1E5QMB4_9CYAN|nr:MULTISPECIES: chromophore lyase CpcT/CpeT [Desertifilum]MDA0210582.1 chromophore lyase CpcT/CpeT [Cyanobacteria bacterium FC1]MBD2311583.1 chromophore lyase CpcT/CpeT [Desertifilum sp. FACHB-1129]MBD2323157.1 chromophore lyase CpcT/CpeT [Desertifilum sp. FACHB-866]MBD2333002.1 chromophore lyase CpcT/CpeT [Desertifilum sp. FACHB-868]OEJ75816.1 chorismate-binding protein [Desertifilum tharense IPPAS B-1220]
MTHSTDIATLARWMAADFSNQHQAFENPPFFAHIRVCMRPLPVELLSGASFYVEQAYDYMLNQPYRSRVLKLIAQNGHIEIENYIIHDEKKFYGASRNLERLQTLSADDLEKLPGCNMQVQWTGHSFKGNVEPGKGCIVVRKGKNTYLDSEFEIDDQKFISLDRGLDLETDEHVWGSVAGPFDFVRWQSFADEVKV